MSSKELHKELPLPLPNGTSMVQPHSKGRLSRPVMAVMAFLAFMGALSLSFNRYPVWVRSFSSAPPAPPAPSAPLKHDNTDLCPGGVSYTGHIPLTDPERKSFYWFFQAQTEDWKTAPTILTFGGGPGITGLSYPLRGESHCVVTSAGTSILNQWAWTKRFNLIALDHPIGVGFSDGTVVGGSAETAEDVYVFLQKFFTLEDFKDLAKNRFIISTGSYGGIYAAHVATVIQSKNRAIAERPRSGIKINLDSVMLNGPVFDGQTYYSHMIEPRCKRKDLFDPEECAGFREKLPACLQKIKDSLESGVPLDRKAAAKFCDDNVDGFAQKCLNKVSRDWASCYPQRTWIEGFIANKKTELGLATSVPFNFSSSIVAGAFINLGDGIQDTQPLYKSLLQDGIRILTYVGKLDYNCHLSGARSFLSLLDHRIALVRKRFSRHRGTEGWTFGKITLIEVASAGHLSVSDKPEIIQDMIEHWIDKKEFLKFSRRPPLN